MTEHTPAPWDILVNEEYPRGAIISVETETLVAEIIADGQNALELMANAKLLKNAPSLLIVVEQFANRLQRLEMKIGPTAVNEIFGSLFVIASEIAKLTRNT